MDQNLQSLIVENREENIELLKNSDQCDKYDYLAAVGCGAIGGMIDIFLVGAPGDSKLCKWTDAQTDNAVKGFAKLTGWDPREGHEDSVASAIGHLENKFRVNYDQRHTGDVNGEFSMSTKNHHLMSLAHSPDPIGLFFSILNQFTSTSTFVTEGHLKTIPSAEFNLKGDNFVSQIFYGIANWFGHIMSDMAGSSGSRGNSGRGAGVAMPFYELFQFCTFGEFQVGKDRQDFAILAKRAYQEGYDFRFGLATAIPVVITDLCIRFIWALRRHFQYEKPLKECIPTSKYSELRVMLLVGNGMLCTMDGIDATVRSGGNALKLFTRLNLIAWFRFATLALKEVCIRTGMTENMQKELDAFSKINQAIVLYLNELERIDINQYRLEVAEYTKYSQKISAASTEEDLNTALLEIYKENNIETPWTGDFDEFMSDSSNHLVFN